MPAGPKVPGPRAERIQESADHFRGVSGLRTLVITAQVDVQLALGKLHRHL